tara:strand:+ start:99 stop:377 length:279 start_codon:yes stop_codon:yes gene_type:complete
MGSFFDANNLDKAIIAILISSVTSNIAKDLQKYFLNPIINHIIIYEDSKPESQDILYLQIVRSFITLFIYLIFIGIAKVILNEAKDTLKSFF